MLSYASSTAVGPVFFGFWRLGAQSFFWKAGCLCLACFAVGWYGHTYALEGERDNARRLCSVHDHVDVGNLD